MLTLRCGALRCVPLRILWKPRFRYGLCAIVTLSLRRAVFQIYDFKNAVTLKTGMNFVEKGVIERIRLPIDVL